MSCFALGYFWAHSPQQRTKQYTFWDTFIQTLHHLYFKNKNNIITSRWSVWKKKKKVEKYDFWWTSLHREGFVLVQPISLLTTWFIPVILRASTFRTGSRLGSRAQKGVNIPPINFLGEDFQTATQGSLVTRTENEKEKQRTINTIQNLKINRFFE